MSRPPITERQRAIVTLIAEGLIDHGEIAEELDVSRNAVRRDISVLCARFGTPARGLPEAMGIGHCPRCGLPYSDDNDAGHECAAGFMEEIDERAV